MNLIRISGLTAAPELKDGANNGVRVLAQRVDEGRRRQAQGFNVNPHLTAHLPQLLGDVAPFAVTQVVEKLPFAHSAEGATRQVT